MTPESDDLDLQELARAAGVTPRTIRYYVQQGLLPTPGRGPGTKYDRAMVERLQLIKDLQRKHLPLSEIRRHLEALDDDAVRLALGSPRSFPGSHAAELPLSDSALRYVHSAHASPEHSVGEPLPQTNVERLRAPELYESPPALSAANVSADAKWQVTKSTWERVRLSTDVELNIRRPLSREQNKQVDELIEAARKIFSEDR